MKSINHMYSGTPSLIPSVGDIEMSTDTGVMYKVSKCSDDDNTLLAFFHNKSKEPTNSRYGRFFMVLKDGRVIQQPHDELELVETTLRQAFEHIAFNPQVAYDLYMPALLAYGKKYVSSDFELKVDTSFNDSAPILLDNMDVLHNTSNEDLPKEDGNFEFKIPDGIAIVEYDTKVGYYVSTTIVDEHFDEYCVDQLRSDAESLSIGIGHERFYQEDKLPHMTLGFSISEEDDDSRSVKLQCFFPLCEVDYWEYEEGDFFDVNNHEYLVANAKRLNEVFPILVDELIGSYT